MRRNRQIIQPLYARCARFKAPSMAQKTYPGHPWPGRLAKAKVVVRVSRTCAPKIRRARRPGPLKASPAGKPSPQAVSVPSVWARWAHCSVTTSVGRARPPAPASPPYVILIGRGRAAASARAYSRSGCLRLNGCAFGAFVRWACRCPRARPSLVARHPMKTLVCAPVRRASSLKPNTRGARPPAPEPTPETARRAVTRSPGDFSPDGAPTPSVFRAHLPTRLERPRQDRIRLRLAPIRRPPTTHAHLKAAIHGHQAPWRTRQENPRVASCSFGYLQGPLSGRFCAKNRPVRAFHLTGQRPPGLSRAPGSGAPSVWKVIHILHN